MFDQTAPRPLHDRNLFRQSCAADGEWIQTDSGHAMEDTPKGKYLALGGIGS